MTYSLFTVLMAPRTRGVALFAAAAFAGFSSVQLPATTMAASGGHLYARGYIALVGQVVKRLQHQNLEHHDGVEGLRPALFFLASGASLTTASISARKLSKGMRALSASSASPLALSAFRRLSRS